VTSIAYLTSIASPYRVAMVEAWVGALGRDFDLTVYYTDKGDQGRGWKVHPIEGAREIRLATIVSIPRYGRLNAGLLKMVRGHDLLIIGGFEQASYLVAAFLARLLGKKVILLFDGFSPSRFDSEKPVVRWTKRVTAGLCHAYFANGTVGARYLRRLNVPPGAIFNQYLSVSTREIDHAAGAGIDREEIRCRFDLPAKVRLVAFCGYLIERKRLDLLIEAVSRLAVAARPVVAVIGSGPLRTAASSLAAQLGVDARFVGFQDSVGLAQLYRAVDLLVLPSNDDPWGLVVNEAMAANLPVIVSDACGCAEDLVIPNRNGFVFRSGDAEHLAECLRQALAADLEAMGRSSRSIIDQWTPAHSGRSLAACIAHVLALPVKQRAIDQP
jgi:glycosyltransferase involved in cell wall biosynthesis